jgi:Concanavalin A-like lectin/glucanases superfamily/FG-GAP-like repeat/IPT/TIG domain/FG-GAP repeat
MKTTLSLFQVLLVALSLALSARGQSFLTNGLVAYYPFNGNANDASGNGNNGTVQGATLTTNRFGVPNSAYLFDGVQSKIQVPETLFGPSNAAYTVSAWVTTDNGPYIQQQLIYEKSTQNGEMNMVIQSGDFGFSANLVGSGFAYVSTPLTSNSVTHLVGVYQQGQSLALYTNGVLATNMPIPNSTLYQESGYPLDSALGIYDYTPAPYFGFHGHIEDFRVYTNALSALQVQELYQYESQPPVQNTTPPVITSFTPASAFVGTNVDIYGTNFSTVDASNIVYFGAVQAEVLFASTTNLVVTVPVGATFAPITVTVNGLTAYSDQPFLPTFPGSGQINSSTFGSPIILPTVSGPGFVVLADLDGDGRPDLVIADWYAADIVIYQNLSSNGITSFGPQLVLPVVPADANNTLSISVADVDGDGKPDIIASTSNSNLIYVFRNISSPGLLTTNSFAAPVIISAGDGSQSIAVRDLNGDGKPDIVIPNSSDDSISILQNQSTIGNISFGAPVNLVTGYNPEDVAIADLDGDGYPDIAVTSRPNGTVTVYRNLGLGGTITSNSFAPAVVLTGITDALRLKIGDIDGDGKPDIVVADWYNDEVSVLRNLTTGPGITANSFAAPVSFPTGGWANNVALGDLNGDGKLEVIVENQLPSLFSVFNNASTPGTINSGSLGPRIDFTSGYNPDDAAIGDLNGDGRADLVLANQYGPSVYVFINNTPPPFPEVTNQPQDVYVDPYQNTQFSVGAIGAIPLSYQWIFDGSAIDYATNDILDVSNIVQSDLGQYSVVITNTFGAVTSSIANMYMYPSLVSPFIGVDTYVGQTNLLSVTVWGSGALDYQWYFNGNAVLGATNATYNLSDVQTTNAGSYSVVVHSTLGAVTNAPAEVVVSAAGVIIELYPGLLVAGTVGYTYIIQSAPDLTNTNDWTTIGTLTLTQPAQLWVDTNLDASLPTNPRRFYRVELGP